MSRVRLREFFRSDENDNCENKSLRLLRFIQNLGVFMDKLSVPLQLHIISIGSAKGTEVVAS